MIASGCSLRPAKTDIGLKIHLNNSCTTHHAPYCRLLLVSQGPKCVVVNVINSRKTGQCRLMISPLGVHIINNRRPFALLTRGKGRNLRATVN